MDNIEHIMKEYGLYPLEVKPITPRLYKITDGQKTFALKKSRLTNQSINTWEAIFHYAYTMPLSNVLPVYLTQTSQLYVKAGDSYYYLTPWITAAELSREQTIRHTFAAIGEVHETTKQSVSINMDTIKHYFKQYQDMSAAWYQELIQYIEQFEQNHYMSPFELQVCTHFPVLHRVLTVIEQQINRFIAELEQNSGWHTSLCHKHLDLSHVCHDQHTYLLNWEHAAYGHPAVDMSRLLCNLSMSYEKRPDQLIDLLPVYHEQHSLAISEQHLLAIYLLDPSSYISTVRAYVKRHREETMLAWTRQLEAAFRPLNTGLVWSDRIVNDPDHAQFN